tara:strand:+ start:457 stop:1470 length:1014 start_codon:yes stop_codon:yes gene_type:complete
MKIKYSLIDNVKGSDISIYFGKSYQNIFSRIYKSSNKYLRIQSKDKIAFIPLIIRELDFQNFEAFTPYGYGGLFGENIYLSNDDLTNLKEYLSKINIHSLFIRHSPFTDNYLQWPKEIIEANRITYQSKLINYTNFNSYKTNLKQKTRASINHAQKYGFSYELIENPLKDNTLEEFYNLYLKRMVEINSSKFYYFDYKFFEDHLINFPERCKLIVIKNKLGKIVSGALFLCDYKDRIVHYHLSGSSKEALNNQCNDLLIAYANFHFGASGFEIMNLGGGIQFDESDGLSKFKKKYSNDKKVFYITKLICDSKTYLETRERLQIKKNKNFFLIGDAIS